MNILTIVLPIFLIILAGYFLRKVKIVEDSWIHALNGFAYYVSLPAIIIASFWAIDLKKEGLIEIALFNILVLIIFAALLLAVLHLLKISKTLKASIFLVALVGNTIYMGFPMGQTAFSQEYFGIVAAAGTVQLVFGILLGIFAVEYLVVKSNKFDQYFLDFIKNPLIISLIVGLILSFLPLKGAFIDILKKTINMLGATASPVALFALGSFLYGKFAKINLPMTVFGTICKLLIFPLLIYVLAKAYGFNFPKVEISTLISAMPAAATTFVIAEKFNLDKTFVANAMLITTAASIFSISILLLVIK